MSDVKKMYVLSSSPLTFSRFTIFSTRSSTESKVRHLQETSNNKKPAVKLRNNNRLKGYSGVNLIHDLNHRETLLDYLSEIKLADR